jgi:hypothetical protein
LSDDEEDEDDDELEAASFVVSLFFEPDSEPEAAADFFLP